MAQPVWIFRPLGKTGNFIKAKPVGDLKFIHSYDQIFGYHRGKNKVGISRVMVYSPVRRPFSVSGIFLHNSLVTIQTNPFTEFAIPTESETELPSTVSDDIQSNSHKSESHKSDVLQVG